eukprot:472650_1
MNSIALRLITLVKRWVSDSHSSAPSNVTAMQKVLTLEWKRPAQSPLFISQIIFNVSLLSNTLMLIYLFNTDHKPCDLLRPKININLFQSIHQNTEICKL